ncbi:20794_t:CDS:2 [Gigaspora margarita]|uniref:20794_t:CDS:1 n=1 Tax=Gigaspora margarita TaxID=4874 RepID=A0ABM8W3P1_GIGMA|nr:20794_t:CDS:2 [Gigaspora margarita]
MVLDISNDTRYAQYGKRGEKSISFQINFFDQNANPSLFVEISDSEPVYLKENISSTFLQSIAMTNTHQILSKEDTYINLGRSIRKIIIPNWKATMGFQPDYELIPYLTSRKFTSRERFMQNNDFASSLIIMADFDITIIETERSSLGLLGGAWSFVIIAYKLLFGDDTIQPFGLIQKHGYFDKLNQKQLTDNLSTIPLVQDSFNNADDENQVVLLEKKISDLELFLREYVVEAQQLDKFYENIENNKNK